MGNKHILGIRLYPNHRSYDMGNDKEVKCPVCKKAMTKDRYKGKKEDGTQIDWYYCEYCCRVREVRSEIDK